MTSREYVAAEAGNTERIILYREGLFWRAYERSAFALCTQVKSFKPTRKVLKTLDGADLISAGFPIGGEKSIMQGFQLLASEPERLVFAALRPIVEKEFRAWKATIPLSGLRRTDTPRGVAPATPPDSKAAELPQPMESDSIGRQQAASVASVEETPATYGEADFSLSVACRVADSIRCFNLADKTPMECMIFISELQKMLVDYR